MNNLREGLQPRRWRLGWNGPSKALIFEIQNHVLGALPSLAGNALVAHVMKKRDFEPLFTQFAYDIKDGCFGFGSNIVRSYQDTEVTRFTAVLPVIARRTTALCKECGGTGKRTDFCEESCLSCQGQGKEWQSDGTSLRILVESISLLLFLLNGKEGEEKVTKGLQHIVSLRISTLERKGIGAYFGSALSEYLRIHLDELPALVQAVERDMKEAHHWVYPRETEYGSAKLRGSLNQYLVDFTVPGNACFINFSCRPQGCGDIEIGDHNVDNDLQLIILLVAFASFVERAGNLVDMQDG